MKKRRGFYKGYVTQRTTADALHATMLGKFMYSRYDMEI